MQMEREHNTKGNLGEREKLKRGEKRMRGRKIFENLIKLDFHSGPQHF